MLEGWPRESSPNDLLLEGWDELHLSFSCFVPVVLVLWSFRFCVPYVEWQKKVSLLESKSMVLMTCCLLLFFWRLILACGSSMWTVSLTCESPHYTSFSGFSVSNVCVADGAGPVRSLHVPFAFRNVVDYALIKPNNNSNQFQFTMGSC